jgi:hypothetical protein
MYLQNNIVVLFCIGNQTKNINIVSNFLSDRGQMHTKKTKIQMKKIYVIHNYYVQHHSVLLVFKLHVRLNPLIDITEL